HSLDDERHETRDGPVQVTRIPGGDRRTALHTEVARWLTYSTEVAKALEELHARTPFDLIDFPDWGCEGYVHLLERSGGDAPAAVQVHGPLVMFGHALGWPDLSSEFFRVGTAMERTYLRNADAVYSSSRCSREWCARHYGLDESRVPILHTGVDTRLFRPLE